MSTVAIHAIWTTYLTWPPGDPRGHWSPLFDFYGHLIDQGHKLNLPDPITVQYATAQTKETERVLTPEDQQIVADMIGLILREDLEGRVAAYASAIERTHTHLLLSNCDSDIDKVIGRIKGKTSSAVIKNGSEPWRERTWTTGFWKVFVYDVTTLPHIQVYIENHNKRRGLSPAPYPWITRSSNPSPGKPGAK
jgi:REP element-mobilizing transposase RayT